MVGYFCRIIISVRFQAVSWRWAVRVAIIEVISCRRAGISVKAVRTSAKLALITSPNVAIKEVKICFKKLKKKIGEKKSRKTRTSAKLQK